jgi:hypothetical protein
LVEVLEPIESFPIVQGQRVNHTPDTSLLVPNLTGGTLLFVPDLFYAGYAASSLLRVPWKMQAPPDRLRPERLRDRIRTSLPHLFRVQV